MLVGLRNLDPGRAGTGSLGAVDPLGKMPSAPSRQPCFKHRRTILSNVFVEQDAHAAIAQQSRQRRLAVEDEEIAQILAIMRDQVEGIRDRGTRGSSANGPPQRGRRRRRPRRSSFSCGKRWKYNACEVAEPMLVAASVVADAGVDAAWRNYFTNAQNVVAVLRPLASIATDCHHRSSAARRHGRRTLIPAEYLIHPAIYVRARRSALGCRPQPPSESTRSAPCP